MSEWKTQELGSLLKDKGYIRGPFGSALKRGEMVAEGIPVYEQKNAIYDEREFRFFITPEKFEELKRFQVKTNDLIISCSGTVGKISIIKEEDPKGIISQALLILRPDIEKITLKFLFYFLTSKQGFNLITQVSHGSVQINIAARNIVETIPVPTPPLEEQKAIASVLSSLDDKIDLLHRQNQTLEQMAETLFRQWFVEEADASWEVKKLKELVDIGIGRTPPRKEFHWFSKSISDVKWVSIKDLGDSGVFVLDTSEYLTEEAVEKFNIPIIPPDTVLLSFKMTLGRVAITTEHMLSNEAIAHFKFNEETPFSKEFLYFYLKTYPYETLGSTSSIVTSINSGMIKDMEAIIPDDETLTKFENQVMDYFDKIRSNQKQINNLSALRDTLLPKLMSGEVRIETETDNK